MTPVGPGAPSRRTFLRYTAGVASVLPLTALAGCSGGRDASTIRVAFQQFGSGTLIEQWIQKASAEFTRKQSRYTVELLPIVASENDYFTKNELLMSSPRTCPDLVYEDTFILLSDVGADYLQPLDEKVSSWKHWDDIASASREAATAEDGHVYAVPTHTDTRALWYHRGIFEKAGLPSTWEPKTWEDVLDAARTIQEQVPEVTPFHIFSGKAQGEKASMQGFEMLLYGTGKGQGLYDAETKKWIIGAQGFVDSLEFLRTVFSEELTLSVSLNLDPNIGETIYTQLMPSEKLGILLDGSWISQNWVDSAPNPWPEWTEQIGLAKMPTQDGGGQGTVTLAGGWCWTIPRYASDADASFAFLEALSTTDLSVWRAISDNHITVRKDVAAQEEYRSYSPTAEFFTSLLGKADYRPTLPAYPEVSASIQEAMESVMTMSATPEDAARTYDAAVTEIVGAENVQEEAR